MVSQKPLTSMVQSETINGPEYEQPGIITGPDYIQTELMNFCYPHGLL